MGKTLDKTRLIDDSTKNLEEWTKSSITIDMDKAFENIIKSAYQTEGYQSMIDEIKSDDMDTPAIPLMKNMCLENYAHNMGPGLYFNTSCQYDENNKIVGLKLVDNERQCVVGEMELSDKHHEALDKAITTAAAGELYEYHIHPNSVTIRGKDGVDPLDPKYSEIMVANAQILKKSPVINSIAVQAKNDDVKLVHGYSVDDTTPSGKARESQIMTSNGPVFTVSKDGNTTGISRIIKSNGSEINLNTVGQLNKQYGNTGVEKSAVVKGACADWMNKTDDNRQMTSEQVQL